MNGITATALSEELDRRLAGSRVVIILWTAIRSCSHSTTDTAEQLTIRPILLPAICQDVQS